MKFSVITVTLNDLAGLQATLVSTLRQHHQDLEAIVIDGGSVGGTKEWLSSQTDGRIRWLSEPDRGLYDAMNKGLDRARGEYVVFMNSGDTFADHEVLRKVAEAAAVQPRPDLVYGDAVDVTTSGRRLYKRARPYETLWRGMFTQHQAMFFSRSTIGSLRHGSTFRLSGDYDFIARFSRQATSSGGPSVTRLDIPLCCFQLGGRSDRGRLRALGEDFAIRRRTMGLGLIACTWLWTAHLVHFLMKRATPGLMRTIRYESAR
jgi:putative colanic acid biosynthesis glycosyltransferase